jgi:hypothetical protein
MPLILAGATSGSTTLQATDAVTATITLPSTSGTVVVNNGAQTIEFADGSASAPSITNSGDTNTGIFFPAADTIAFTEGGTESMRIDSSGRLSVASYGTFAAPTIQLAETTYGFYVENGFLASKSGSDGYAWWNPAGSARNMVLNASGNLGLGVTPSAWGSDRKALQVNSGSLEGAISAPSYVNVNANCYIGSDNATNRYVATGFASRYTQYEGQHQWLTSASGTTGNAITFTQAMTLNASGKLGVGTTTPTGNLSVVTTSGQGASIGTWTSSYAVISPNAGSATGAALGLAYNTTSNASEILSIAPSVAWRALHLFSSGLGIYSNNGTLTASVDSSGSLILVGSTAQKATGTTWSNPSDIRLKDNVTDYSKGLAELMQVNVKEWTYNGKGGTTEGMKGLGVIADEIMTVLPDTVDTYQAKLNAKDKNDTGIKKFDATEITWLMLNAIKELKAIVDTQAEQIKALQGAA